MINDTITQEKKFRMTKERTKHYIYFQIALNISDIFCYIFQFPEKFIYIYINIYIYQAFQNYTHANEKRKKANNNTFINRISICYFPSKINL